MEALAQVAGQLGIDQSFFYLFGIMFVLYALLSATYLKPFQHVLHDRKLKTEGAKKEAEALKTQAEEAFSSYKVRLKEVNEKARETSRQLEDSARAEESKILAEAGAKARDTLQNTQRDLDAQRKAIVDALSGEISGIANEIATKVLGRSLSAK